MTHPLDLVVELRQVPGWADLHPGIKDLCVRAAAEIARLRAEVERLDDWRLKLSDDDETISRLHAEIDRLRALDGDTE